MATKTDIIDLAEEMSGVKVPGKAAEEKFDAMYLEFVDQGKPRLVTAKGLLTGTAGERYPLPGYVGWVYVSLDGTALGSIPIDHLYFNSQAVADSTATVSTGFVIMGESIKFSGDSEDVEAGTAYEVIYYSRNIGISPIAEPSVPSKLHLPFAEELAIRFRLAWSKTLKDRTLTPDERLERNKNVRIIRIEGQDKTTQRNVPVQPDSFWTNY